MRLYLRTYVRVYRTEKIGCRERTNVQNCIPIPVYTTYEELKTGSVELGTMCTILTFRRRTLWKVGGRTKANKRNVPKKDPFPTSDCKKTHTSFFIFVRHFPAGIFRSQPHKFNIETRPWHSDFLPLVSKAVALPSVFSWTNPSHHISLPTDAI